MPAPRGFKSPEAFRAWLARYGSTRTELVVRLFKQAARHRGITYSDALDEALCYGWIDGVRHALDAESYTVRFTPRQPRSIWSRVNVGHVERLMREQRMAPGGLSAFAARTPERTGVYAFEQGRVDFSLPFLRRLRSDKPAWAWFAAQPPGYRRICTHWVMSAKQKATRERRLELLRARSAAGRRIPSQE